jgi:GNAT superfamily N-acetyltransferase
VRARVSVALSRADILACQYLIAEVYNREYEVVFSDDRYDLDAKIEPWPHRYLMCHVDGELAATFGLYLRDTYVERFGRVSDDDVTAMLTQAGATGRVSLQGKRELTKLVVRPKFRGRGLARFILGAAHARAFCQMESERDRLLVSCAKRTIWANMWTRAGIHTRVIKAFPLYRVHELYRSEDDPMDSRLIIPDLDIPPHWYHLDIPGEYEVNRFGELR